MWPVWSEVPAMITDRAARRPAGSAILLVDDEPRIQGFITRALSGAGHAIDRAPVGAAALRLARRSESGLVILDLVMPDMDGRHELAEMLHAHPDQVLPVLSC